MYSGVDSGDPESLTDINLKASTPYHMGWWFFIIKGSGLATIDEPFLAFPRSTWCHFKKSGLNHWIVLVNQVAGIALPELGSTTYVPGILIALDRLF